MAKTNDRESETMNLATYAFDVCWFDQVASLKRFYKLLYHVRKDGADEIEVGPLGRRVHCMFGRFRGLWGRVAG